jgi:hypothetical protein
MTKICSVPRGIRLNNPGNIKGNVPRRVEIRSAGVAV